MTTALLDADIIAYRAAAKYELDFGDGKSCDEQSAIEYALKLVNDWKTLARAGAVVLCFSPRDGMNFRKDIAAEYAKQSGQETYKANRGEKPVAYWSVVDALEDAHKVVRFPGCEADDVMGVMATDGRINRPVIVSIDKDMLTIPAKVLNPDKQKRSQKITKAAANREWLVQTLSGDATDGYKGCPRIGDKIARRVISPSTTLRDAWKVIVECFERQQQTVDDALYNARMARILRADDYVDGEIRLWHPHKGQQRRLAYT